MTDVRIASVDQRLDRPGLLAASLGLVRRAVGVGLLADRAPIEVLDLGLLQEIAREANTIASKSGDVEIARRVVEIKTAIDRIKEQAQNAE